eukprot:9255290-Alexandrium_andersonii.AAC.1
MSLTRWDRAAEVDEVFGAQDVVMLTGTQLRCDKGEVRQLKYKHHWALSYGYHNGAFSNKSAGVQMMFRNK